MKMLVLPQQQYGVLLCRAHTATRSVKHHFCDVQYYLSKRKILGNGAYYILPMLFHQLKYATIFADLGSVFTGGMQVNKLRQSQLSNKMFTKQKKQIMQTSYLKHPTTVWGSVIRVGNNSILLLRKFRLRQLNMSTEITKRGEGLNLGFPNQFYASQNINISSRSIIQFIKFKAKEASIYQVLASYVLPYMQHIT